jgi:hypothetical protein
MQLETQAGFGTFCGTGAAGLAIGDVRVGVNWYALMSAVAQ